MVLVKKWPVFLVFLLGNIGHENFFYNILERKNVFLAYKKKKFKKSKNWDFSKGVNPWFWSKNGHFSMSFFFLQYTPGKCDLQYSRTKKTPFYPIKTTRPKSRKIEPIKKRSSKRRKIEIFLKGLTHGFVQKMAIFPSLFFFSNIGKENVFYNILEQKTPV